MQSAYRVSALPRRYVLGVGDRVEIELGALVLSVAHHPPEPPRGFHRPTWSGRAVFSHIAAAGLCLCLLALASFACPWLTLGEAADAPDSARVWLITATDEVEPEGAALTVLEVAPPPPVLSRIDTDSALDLPGVECDLGSSTPGVPESPRSAGHRYGVVGPEDRPRLGQRRAPDRLTNGARIGSAPAPSGTSPDEPVGPWAHPSGWGADARSARASLYGDTIASTRGTAEALEARVPGGLVKKLALLSVGPLPRPGARGERSTGRAERLE